MLHETGLFVRELCSRVDLFPQERQDLHREFIFDGTTSQKLAERGFLDSDLILLFLAV